MNVDTSTIQTEIITDITAELGGIDTFSASVLAVKVKNAIRDVMARRNYAATSFSPDKILADLYDHYSTIYNLAIYDYNQVGMNGQTAHNENGINRTWANRDDILRGVHAFVGTI